MKRCGRFGAVAVMSSWAVGLAAEERLTLLEAVERGLSHYPSVRASLAELDVTEEAVEEAAAARFPAVSLGAAARRYQEPYIVHPIHAFEPGLVPPFDRTLFQVQGDLGYTVFDGGARRSQLEQSRARREGAATSVEETRERLVLSILQAYLGTLAERTALRAHESSIAALELELSRVRQLLEVGRAARVDVLRVEAALAAARAARVQIASAIDVSERHLARLTGAPIGETQVENLVSVSFPEESSSPEREELLRRALAENAALRRTRDELAMAEAAVRGSRSRLAPTVDLDGRYIYYGGASGAGSLEWNVGVSLSYPVFTGGAISSAIAGALAAERQAAERVKWIELEVAGELDRTLASLEETAARMEALATAVARYAEVSRIERLRLDTGTGTESDYIRAEADLLEARSSLIEAQYGAIVARAEIARVTGELGPRWIEARLRNEP